MQALRTQPTRYRKDIELLRSRFRAARAPHSESSKTLPPFPEMQSSRSESSSLNLNGSLARSHSISPHSLHARRTGSAAGDCAAVFDLWRRLRVCLAEL